MFCVQVRPARSCPKGLEMAFALPLHVWQSPPLFMYLTANAALERGVSLWACP